MSDRTPEKIQETIEAKDRWDSLCPFVDGQTVHIEVVVKDRLKLWDEIGLGMHTKKEILLGGDILSVKLRDDSEPSKHVVRKLVEALIESKYIQNDYNINI